MTGVVRLRYALSSVLLPTIPWVKVRGVGRTQAPDRAAAQYDLHERLITHVEPTPSTGAGNASALAIAYGGHRGGYRHRLG